MADQITILKVVKPNAVAAKQFYINETTNDVGVIKFDIGSKFLWEVKELNSITSISSLLTELEKDNLSFIVRGEPKEKNTPNTAITRNKEKLADMPVNYRISMTHPEPPDVTHP